MTHAIRTNNYADTLKVCQFEVYFDEQEEEGEEYQCQKIFQLSTYRPLPFPPK